jgi:hypothetical protein
MKTPYGSQDDDGERAVRERKVITRWLLINDDIKEELNNFPLPFSIDKKKKKKKEKKVIF